MLRGRQLGRVGRCGYRFRGDHGNFRDDALVITVGILRLRAAFASLGRTSLRMTNLKTILASRRDPIASLGGQGGRLQVIRGAGRWQ